MMLFYYCIIHNCMYFFMILPLETNQSLILGYKISLDNTPSYTI